MQSARLRNVEVPQNPARLAIELDHPASRARWPVEGLHTAPQHSAHQLQRIDPSKVGNLAEEISVEVELLDPAVFPIGHVDCSFLVNLDRMWQAELAGTRAGLAPLLHPLAVGGVFEDSRVPIPIRVFSTS